MQVKESKFRIFWVIAGGLTDDRFYQGTADNMSGQNCKHHWVVAGVQTDDDSI